MHNLQGRNYIFRVAPTYRAIHAEACYAVASKTKKNVLLTIKVGSRSCDQVITGRLRVPLCLSLGSALFDLQAF